jgi:hypothetical protein
MEMESWRLDQGISEVLELQRRSCDSIESTLCAWLSYLGVVKSLLKSCVITGEEKQTSYIDLMNQTDPMSSA